jgi:hypothetical protein
MHTNLCSKRRSVVEWTSAAVAIMLLLVLAAGCGSVNHLREAQDAFNQAAAAENVQRFDASPADAVVNLAAPRSGYASALLSLSKLAPNDEKRLRQDGLWGTTLTLKALSQWRLGQFQSALASAAEAQKTAAEQLYPRDRAVLAALPGLIKTDQAYSKIQTSGTPFADVEALLIGDNGAVDNIQRGRDLVDKDHPVQIYLLQAQLAAYLNYLVGQDRLNNHATVPPEHPARVKANAQLKELDRLLKMQQPGSPNQGLVNYWAQRCALDVP